MSEAPALRNMRRLRQGIWAAITIIPLVVMGFGVLYVATHWSSLNQALLIPKGQSTLEQLLGTPEVVLGIRLGALAIGFYLASSVLALAIQGRWIVKAGTGGVETAQVHSLGTLQEASAELEKRVTVLEDTLSSTSAKVETRLDQQKEGLKLMTAAITELIDEATRGHETE